MNRRNIILVFLLIVVASSCKKEEVQQSNSLPEGATPYSEADIQFVPYTSEDLVFKRMPALDSTIIFNFKERKRTEEYFAWDQTYFTFNVDPDLEVEFRLRYLQTDNSQKTLAMYMPYRDSQNEVQRNIFEIPLTATDIETGFFQNLVEYHDTIVINSQEWYKVFEVTELISTDPDDDGPTNFNRIYYNKTFGIIEMDQKNGYSWVLQP